MLDIFHVLAAIPDAIMAIAHRPKLALTAISLAIVAAVTLECNRQQTEPQQAIAEHQATEPQKPERRITKIVKWLWSKE